MVQGETPTISIGMVWVDLYDPARKRLVWRGDAGKSIDLRKSPAKSYKMLQKTMGKLFRSYPPPPNLGASEPTTAAIIDTRLYLAFSSGRTSKPAAVRSDAEPNRAATIPTG